jgi:hypothetical protein
MQPTAVKVDIYGTIRDLVKETRMEVVLPEQDRPTFKDVLDKLVERFGRGRLIAWKSNLYLR